MQINTEWNLDRYFIEGKEEEYVEKVISNFEKDIDSLLSKYKSFTKKNLIKWFEDNEKVYLPIYRLSIYISLKLSTDTSNQSLIKLSARLSDVFRKASDKTGKSSEKFKNTIGKKFSKISKKKKFKDYRNYMENYHTEIKYDLGEKIEKYIRSKNSVISIFKNIFSEYNGNLQFDYRGEKLNDSEIRAKRSSMDESERKDAYLSMKEVFNSKSNKIIFGGIYTSVCKSQSENVKNRKHDSPISIRNLSEEMDNSSVDSLLKYVTELFPLYQEFLRKKAKALGKEKLNMWDISAPYPTSVDKKYSFEEGLNLYLNEIKKFDQEFYEYSIEMINDERVHVYPKQNKRSGAFAQYYKDVPSFVLLNWTDKIGDITTLAHEFGHAIHGWYSQKQNSYVYSSPLCLAETASIFNETIIFETLLSQSKEDEKNPLIFERLQDIFATVFRQVMYVNFENRCHNEFLNGNNLTWEDYDTIWFEEQTKLYGDAVILNKDDDSYGWSTIPHLFRTPFYCYAYAFGNILSLSLYNMYNVSEDKEEFKTMYKKILKSGGLYRPKKLLSKYGIDIDGKPFYDNLKNEIEKLLKQI